METNRVQEIKVLAACRLWLEKKADRYSTAVLWDIVNEVFGKSLLEQEKDSSDVVDGSQPIHTWFELSYAQFLTVPRLVMESMPQEWQWKMAALLTEMDNTFDWRPENGRYWVKLKDYRGRFCDAPLNDYRHGNIEHLRRQKTE